MTTIRKFFSHDWTKIGAIVLTMVSIAVAFEHRITVIETIVLDIKTHETADNERFLRVGEEMAEITQNNIRQTILLDTLERRVSVLEIRSRPK